MAKSGGAVKRLTEKAKHYNMRLSHGGFARFAEHDQNKLDRRAGGARLVEPKQDKTIPEYDGSMVKRLEPGKFRPIYFGQEPRREVTCYGNGTRRDLSDVCRGAQVYVTELLGPDKRPKSA